MHSSGLVWAAGGIRKDVEVKQQPSFRRLGAEPEAVLHFTLSVAFLQSPLEGLGQQPGLSARSTRSRAGFFFSFSES